MRDKINLDSFRNPIDATFELTVRCNLKCKMCMFRHCTSENKELISRELTAKEWIKIAEDAAKMGTGSLLITGGEPMLRQDFPEIYRGIYKQGFIISLYTNATLVDEKMMELLRECPPHKIGISIYGASSETYSKVCGNGDAFQKAIEGAKKLITLPSVVDFRTTIIEDNYEDAYKIDDLVKKEFGDKYSVTMTRMVLRAVRGGCADVGSCRLSPEKNALFPQERAIEKLKEFIGEDFDINNVRFRQERKNTDCENSGQETVSLLGCSGGMRSYCVTYDGKLQACQALGQFTTDVKNNGLEKAWKEFPSAVKLPPMNEKCKNCGITDFCQCCPASRYAETGSIAGCPEYACLDAQVASAFFERKSSDEVRKTEN